MNAKARAIVMAVAIASAAVSAQAADQSAFFEQQREMTDGYAAPSPIVSTPARSKPETAHQAAENAWLTAERISDSGNHQQIPFPVPASAPEAPRAPETPSQAAENAWLTAERASDSLDHRPVPFPVSTR